MGKTIISVRDVDEKVFRKFRSMSIEEKTRLGDALTKAMRKIINEKDKEGKNRSPRVKPFSWGKGSERTSEEVDKIIYS